MYRLKDKYNNNKAIVILAGPSLIEQNFNFAELSKFKDKGYVTFLDTKALTPYFLKFGFEPDYYMMPFPEKSKDNSIQQFIYRSFLAKMNIKPLIKPVYHNILKNMQDNFNTYFEVWNPEKGPHKNYKYKSRVYLKDSPYDLLKQIPNTNVITNKRLFYQFYPDYNYNNQLYFFDYFNNNTSLFNVDEYFHPVEKNNEVLLLTTSFLNSAAIALYPLLNYMGFKEVYFLGMDMSMLGSFEYAAIYSFRSMFHFWLYFMRAKRSFNASYKCNKPYYYRPLSEFNDAKVVFGYKKMKFYRVYDLFKYSAEFNEINTITMRQFLNQIES